MSRRLLMLFATVITAAALAPATAFADPVECADPADPGQDLTSVGSGWYPGAAAIGFAGCNVDAFEYELDGDTSLVDAAPWSVNVSGNGAHVFRHRARDANSGTWTDWVDEVVRIDAVDPVNTTSVNTAWTRGPVTVNLTGNDTDSGIDHYEWRLDSADPSDPWTTGATAVVSGTGAHKLETAVIDNAGNRAERSDWVNIDDEAPTDTSTTTPAGWQQQAVELTLDGSDTHSGINRIEFRIDADPIHFANPGDSITIDEQGKHLFLTRIVDNAGNTSGWRVQDVWIDIVGPIDTTVVPSDWVTTPTVDVNLSATTTDGVAIATVEYKLDDAPVYSLYSGSPIVVSGDGVHTLETRITDTDGRVATRTHTIRIDTVQPVDTTDIAEGWLPYGTLNASVRGGDVHSGVARVEWRLDGGSVENATAPSHDVTISGDGVHVLETRVVDNAGLASGWIEHEVKLDSTPPANLTPPAPAGWRNTPYSVTLNGSDAGSGVASVGYKIGASAETLRSPGSVVTISDDGSYTLMTRVHDVAGTVSNWRTELIQIDTVAPTDETVYPTASVPNRHVITFAPNDDRSGVARVEYQLDGGEAKTAASVTVSGDGTHTLRVRVRDNAGNWSDWSDHELVVELALDTVAPTDTTTVPSDWLVAPYTVTISATDDEEGSGIDHVEWRIDDQQIQIGPSGSTILVATDGAHTIDTRAFDLAGNRSEWKSQVLRIDRLQPVDTSGLGGGGWVNSRTLTLSATDSASGVEKITYTITGAATLNGTITGAAGNIALPIDGEYAVSYSIFDHAGQRTNRVAAYRVDTVPPGVVLNCGSAAPRTGPVTCSVQANGGASGLASVTVNGTPTGSTYRVNESGTVTLQAVDGAGNVATATANVTIQPAPTPTPTPPAGGGATAPLPPRTPTGKSTSKPKVANTASDAADDADATEAVFMRKGPGSRLLGQLAVKTTAKRTTVDLRPLALGKGRFQFELKIRAGKKTKTVRRTQNAAKGYSKRIRFSVALSGASTVSLSVRKRSGKRWVAYASAIAKVT